MGIFFQAFVTSDFFGKLIFLALFALSCGSWIFMVHKLWSLKQIRRSATNFKKLTEMHKEQILSLNSHSKNPFGILYGQLKTYTLLILDKNHSYHQEDETYLSGLDIKFLESHLNSSILKEKERIENNLFILSTSKSLAPFLGLLGTVWGILIAFGELKSGLSVTSNSAILSGLSTALTTTVLGLLIAIPALIAHSYIKNLCKNFTLDMVEFSRFLLSTVELQYRKVDIS